MRALFRAPVVTLGMVGLAAAGAASGAFGCSKFADSGDGPADGGTEAAPPAKSTLRAAYATGLGSQGTAHPMVTGGDLAVAATGEAFLVGTYSGDTANVFGTQSPLPSDTDAFLAQLTGNGAPSAVSFIALSKPQSGVAVASHGSQVIEGVDFDGVIVEQDAGAPSGDPLVNQGTSNVAILGVDQGTGVVSSAYGLLGSGNTRLRALSAPSSTGAVIALGEYDGSVMLKRPAVSPQTKTRAGTVGPAIFVASLFPPPGSSENLRDFCEEGSKCFANALSSTDDQSVIGGRFLGKIDFGTAAGVLSSSGSDGYVAVLDATLFPKWSHAFTGANGVREVTAVSVLPGTSDVVVAGTFGIEVLMPGATTAVQSKGGIDVFVARFDKSGALLWSKTFGGIADDTLSAVTADAAGNVFVAGSFQSPTIDFGGPALDNAGTASGRGTSDIYVAWLGDGGKHVYSTRFGGADDDLVTQLRMDGTGNMVMLGSYLDSIDFGNGIAALPNVKSPSLFLAKLTR